MLFADCVHEFRLCLTLVNVAKRIPKSLPGGVIQAGAIPTVTGNSSPGAARRSESCLLAVVNPLHPPLIQAVLKQF